MNKAILLTAVLLANLTLMGAAPLMTQKDLKFTWIKNNPNYVVTFTPEIARAECKENQRQSLAIQADFNRLILAGQSYVITFRARGTTGIISVQPQFNSKGSKNLLSDAELFEDWKKYEVSFTAPADAKTFSCAIYSWNRLGHFEIRDFSVVLKEEKKEEK